MRFVNIGSYKTSMTYFLKKKEYQKILMTNLGFNSDEADEVINASFLNFPRHRLLSNCLICQKYNVSVHPADLHSCITLNSHKLEHRINLLKDLGVSELKSSLINKGIYLLRRQMSVFKKKTNIPADYNVVENIFNRLGREVAIDTSQLKVNDKMTTKQYYETCLLHCKTKIFNLPYLDDEILLHSYMKCKSISMIAETLKILRVDLDYNEQMIRKNPVIITASADNIRSFLSNFTDIYGIPIATFLRKYPKMLFQDADNVKELLISFKRYEIPKKQVMNFVDIFEMCNDTFLRRIDYVKRHPDLHVWYKHPRILRVIFHKKMTNDRVEYLQTLNCMKWARPNTLLTTKIYIDKFAQNAGNLCISKKGLKHVLNEELGVDMSDVLMKHQYWKVRGFVEIEQMLKYLKKHFTISEICQNIHIILYSQSRVEELLNDLKRQYSQSSRYKFTNGQYLALCLYMLEKNTNFTGDGVWFDERNVRQQSSHLLKDRNISIGTEDKITANNIDNNLNHLHDKDGHEVLSSMTSHQ